MDAMLRCDRSQSLKDCACADLVLLHRLFDLKSHNVLLTRDGTAKIADVGLAKVLTQVWERDLPPPLQHSFTTLCACQPQSCSKRCDSHDYMRFTKECNVHVTFPSSQLLAPGSRVQGYVSKLDEVAGTFAWAAPELLMGGRCSEKVDIFSFGVVLWELATCERPQRGAMRDVRYASCCAFCLVLRLLP